MKRLALLIICLTLSSLSMVWGPPSPHYDLMNMILWEKHQAEKARYQRVENILSTIRILESANDYSAEGGSGEYGAYQFKFSTFDKFSREYFGELLDIKIPENQDMVARKKVEALIDAGFSDTDIAAIWNSGSHLGWQNKAGVNKHGVRYNVPRYVEKFIATLGTMEIT